MAAFPRHSHMAPAHNPSQTHEINIPNDLIGCIIGRGGSKINEIRSVIERINKLSFVIRKHVLPKIENLQ